MNILKIIGIAAGVAAAGLAGLALTNPGNVAETSADGKDEFLRPRKYKTDLPALVAETEKILPNLTTYGQNWRLISSETSETSALVKAEIPVAFFTDDLEIRAEAQNDETIVNVRSSSRVGSSDFGENRRHVRQLLAALDEKFAAAK